MKVNEYAKQYFLYAKGWYKTSNNHWEDLKKIYSTNHFINKNTYKNDILNKLTQCAFECILEENRSKSLNMLQEFVFKLSPISFENEIFNKKLNYTDRLLKECLSIMRNSIIENLYPEVDCNFNILPKNKEL